MPQLAEALSTDTMPTPRKHVSFVEATSHASTAAQPPAEQEPEAALAAEAQAAAGAGAAAKAGAAVSVKTLPKAGSLTSEGISADERFRITYEARQMLFNVCGLSPGPISGHVAKGLLVVPGQWARLSNISEEW